MTEALRPARRKNPMLRTRPSVLPPAIRSRVALGMSAAAAEGRFELQVCGQCTAVQYPPREACGRCLADDLHWREQDGRGVLLAETELAHSNDLYFRERLPWRLGLVRLDAGVSVVAHLHGAVAGAGEAVKITAMLDRAGQAVLFALPEKDVAHMQDDRQFREMTCDPKFRKVLITDGRSAIGQAMARAFVEAGAKLVWVGQSEPWKKFPGADELAQLPGVSLQPLDVTNEKSVREMAAEIGGRVDILVNTARLQRNHGIQARPGTESMRAQLDVNFLGLLRLAQEFGPALRARAADGQSNAVAWVNILSIFALSNFPPQGSWSATQAAAHSLAQCLRAEMRPAGIRVVNVFPGPIDDEWNKELPPPKLTPAALAKAVITGLQRGVEDIYPGDLAGELRERWRENPKILERELADERS